MLEQRQARNDRLAAAYRMSRRRFVPLEQRINDDLHYVKHWSLIRDIEIILKKAFFVKDHTDR